MNEEKLTKINNKLKIYLNEAGFISMKCRNKLLKIFCEEFLVDLDISNYKNVDLKIKDDYSVLYPVCDNVLTSAQGAVCGCGGGNCW